MENVADCLKQNLVRNIERNLQGLHKKRGDNKFGTMLNTSAKKERVIKLNERRKKNRNNLIFELRQINATMTPEPTPANGRKQQTNSPNKRLEMLAKWKAEKENRAREEKHKSKPIFKVCHIPVDVGLPNLRNVNIEIKGKPFKSQFAPDNHKFKPPANIKPVKFSSNEDISGVKPKTNRREKPQPLERSRIWTRSQTTTSTPVKSLSKQAGSKNGKESKAGVWKSKNSPEIDLHLAKKVERSHKKRQEQNFVESVNEKVTRSHRNKVQEKSNSVDTVDGKISRSSKKIQKNLVTLEKGPEDTAEEKVSRSTKKTKQKNLAGTPLQDVAEIQATSQTVTSPLRNGSTCTLSQSSMSPDFPVDYSTNRSTNQTPAKTVSPDTKTPAKSESAPVYISPFVTVSRGKSSARKEYEIRRSKAEFSPDADLVQYTSPRAGAAYFSKVLNNEISRLENVCSQWNKYKEEESLSEDATSLIDVSIGQCNLLLTSKFLQFKGLIDECRNQTSDISVTCEDLHGFWDTIYLQVTNVDKRFANLDKLRSNDWQDFLPEPKKVAPKKKGRPVKNAKATSALKEAIQAARRKKKLTQNDDEESTGSKNCDTIKPSRKTPQSKRKSILSAIQSTESRRRNSSPGLMMMKVAQFAKSVESGTPAKSILKTESSKSTTKKSKAVLFKEDDEQTTNQSDCDLEDIENNLNKSNSFTNSTSKVKTPSRRSMRLSRAKLF